MEISPDRLVFVNMDFISVLLRLPYCDPRRLPATTAPSGASAATAAATTAEASATTIQTAAARSHAGGATVAVAARGWSVEYPGTASEGIAVTCATARKISAADAVGTAGS
jgi:hypothetical protein